MLPPPTSRGRTTTRQLAISLRKGELYRGQPSLSLSSFSLSLPILLCTIGMSGPCKQLAKYTESQFLLQRPFAGPAGLTLTVVTVYTAKKPASTFSMSLMHAPNQLALCCPHSVSVLVRHLSFSLH